MLRLPKLAHHLVRHAMLHAWQLQQTSLTQRSYQWLGRRLPLWIDDRCWCSWQPPRLIVQSMPQQRPHRPRSRVGTWRGHLSLPSPWLNRRLNTRQLVAARASSAGRCAGTLSGVGVVIVDCLGLYRGGLRRSIEPSPPVHSLAGLGRVLAMVTCSSRNSEMVLQVLAIVASSFDCHRDTSCHRASSCHRGKFLPSWQRHGS
jgi:hypothetical protein